MSDTPRLPDPREPDIDPPDVQSEGLDPVVGGPPSDYSDTADQNLPPIEVPGDEPLAPPSAGVEDGSHQPEPEPVPALPVDVVGNDPQQEPWTVSDPSSFQGAMAVEPEAPVSHTMAFEPSGLSTPQVEPAAPQTAPAAAHSPPGDERGLLPPTSPPWNFEPEAPPDNFVQSDDSGPPPPAEAGVPQEEPSGAAGYPIDEPSQEGQPQLPDAVEPAGNQAGGEAGSGIAEPNEPAAVADTISTPAGDPEFVPRQKPMVEVPQFDKRGNPLLDGHGNPITKKVSVDSKDGQRVLQDKAKAEDDRIVELVKQAGQGGGNAPAVVKDADGNEVSPTGVEPGDGEARQRKKSVNDIQREKEAAAKKAKEGPQRHEPADDEAPTGGGQASGDIKTDATFAITTDEPEADGSADELPAIGGNDPVEEDPLIGGSHDGGHRGGGDAKAAERQKYADDAAAEASAGAAGRDAEASGNAVEHTLPPSGHGQTVGGAGPMADKMSDSEKLDVLGATVAMLLAERAAGGNDDCLGQSDDHAQTG